MNSRSATTWRCLAGSRIRAAISPGSTGLTPSVAATSARAPGSAIATSRRLRRHREMLTFSAVRTTHASGAGCLPTFRHDAHARANASATNSWAVSRSPTLTRTVIRHSSLDRR
jgi:hypothetical protein